MNASVPDLDHVVVLRAQKKLKSLYKRARYGGWRAVMRMCKLSNVSYVYDLAVNGVVPKNPDIRWRLFLPRVMPSERKPRCRRGLPEWGRVAGSVDVAERIGKK